MRNCAVQIQTEGEMAIKNIYVDSRVKPYIWSIFSLSGWGFDSKNCERYKM